jgi:hypothetical protein
MSDKVYLLIEEHRFIKPRRFTIIAAYDSPESAKKDLKSYSKHITCEEYPYMIKLEEWDAKSNEFKN